MSEDLDRIAEHLRIAGLLIKKHKNEVLNSQEEQELQEWLSKAQTNQLLFSELQDRRQIAEELAKLDPAAKQAALEDIRKVLFPVSGEYVAPVLISKNIPVRKLVWRFSAAAVLIGTIAAVYLLYVHRTGSPVPATLTQPAPLANLAPGRSRATLTLSDGKIISLDSASNGLITEQAGAKILKLDKGQLAYNASEKESKEVEYNTLTTPRGGQFKLVLPDGTDVWLNAGSSITYPTVFKGPDRKVTITGEAYFEVAKNKTMPFRVKVGNLLVEVLGTHFNIMAYEDEAVSKTTLLEGSIRINKGDQTALLNPGQQAQVGSNIHINKDANTEEAIAWKNHVFEFNSADIETIMRSISRWYDVEVKYEGVRSNQKLTAIVSLESNASEILKILETSGYHFKVEGRTITVNP